MKKGYRTLSLLFVIVYIDGSQEVYFSEENIVDDEDNMLSRDLYTKDDNNHKSR